MRPVTVVVFFLGIFAGIAAPIFRRYGKAGIALAGGAAMLVIVAVTGLLHQDMRDGLATVEANRRQYRMLLECALPVLALAPVSPLAKEAFLGRLGDSCGVYSVCSGNRDMAGVFLAVMTTRDEYWKLRSFLHPVWYSVRMTTLSYHVYIEAWLKQIAGQRSTTSSGI